MSGDPDAGSHGMDESELSLIDQLNADPAEVGEFTYVVPGGPTVTAHWDYQRQAPVHPGRCFVIVDEDRGDRLLGQLQAGEQDTDGNRLWIITPVRPGGDSAFKDPFTAITALVAPGEA